MNLEEARRLMEEALLESALGAEEELAALKARRNRHDELRDVLESERLAWSAERAALGERILELEERLRALRERTRQESEQAMAMIAALESERASVREAEERTRSALEEGRAAFAVRESELQVRLRAMEAHHRAELDALRRQTQELLNRSMGGPSRA